MQYKIRSLLLHHPPLLPLLLYVPTFFRIYANPMANHFKAAVIKTTVDFLTSPQARYLRLSSSRESSCDNLHWIYQRVPTFLTYLSLAPRAASHFTTLSPHRVSSTDRRRRMSKIIEVAHVKE